MTLTPGQVLEAARTVAVVGCSANPRKAAHYVPQALADAGYRIVPVHPSAERILGQRAYPSLLDVAEPIDLVNVFRPAAEAADVARQAVAVGAKALWLQLGIRSAEARRIAEEAGLAYVEDRCASVELRRYGIVVR